MWAQSGIVYSNLELGDDAAAKKAYKKMIIDYKDHPDLPTAMFFLAEHYYKKATDPNNLDQISPAQDNFQNAIRIWQSIIDSYPDFASTPDCYYFIADSYYLMGEHKKAIEYFQIITNQYPDFEYRWHTLFLIARNYQGLKMSGAMSPSEAKLNIEVIYKQLIEEYPDCKAAKHAKKWLSRTKRSKIK